MTGGQHASLGDATHAVKTALLTRFQTALATAGENQVDVGLAFVWPPQWPDQIAITATTVSSDEETVTLQRRQHKTLRQDVSITVFRATADQGEALDRASTLLDVIDQAVRAEPTLDGAALWCFSDDLASDGVTGATEMGEGRVEEIVVTYAARILITRP